MMLSIVMPVFHAAHYLGEHIRQLQSHDLRDVQLVAVVCDDGADDTAAVCAQLLEGMDNAICIIQPEQGLSVARNTGLQAATGEYVLFMDSDDLLLEPGFATLMAALDGAKADVLVCKYALLQQDGRDVWPTYPFPKANSPAEARQAIYADLPDSIWNVWRYLCRRDFLLEHHLDFVPGLICEDVEWTPRMLEAAASIAFVDATVYGYNYNRPGRLSGRSSVKRSVDINKTVAEGIALYWDKPYGEPLCYRLIRESFYSISEYARFGAGDRKIIRPYIEACLPHYHLSPDRLARLCAASHPFVPLYCWSLALWLAKSLRGALKGLLGANTAKPYSAIEQQDSADGATGEGSAYAPMPETSAQ